MIKNCVVLDGKVINIGEWDEQIMSVEITPPEYNETGELVKEAVYEEQAMNPLPSGATIEEREVEQDTDGGWKVSGEAKAPTMEERQTDAENAIAFLMDMQMMGGGM